MSNVIKFPTPQRKLELVSLEDNVELVDEACMAMNSLDSEIDILSKLPAHIISEVNYNDIPAWKELAYLAAKLTRIADHAMKYEAFVESEIAKENKKAADFPDKYKNHPLVGFESKTTNRPDKQ